MSTVASDVNGQVDVPAAHDGAGLRDTARAQARGSVCLNLGCPGDDPSIPVVLVGPPRDSVGGMSSVMGQMASLEMGGRYSFVPFYATSAPAGHERPWSKVVRHLLHLYKLRDAIRACGAGIAHIHTCSGVSFARSMADLLVARHEGCKTVLHIHGAKFDEFFASRGAVGRRMVAGAMRLSDHVVALSETWQRQLAAMSPRARIIVMENATAIPDEAAAPRREGPCRFLFLGRMDAWKGIDDLLDAAQLLTQSHVSFHLTLAGPPGTAGDADILNGKIAARGLRGVVDYLGPVLGLDKDRLFREADVYVQPSHNEGMPISLLEALAYSLPVIATRVGAVPEVLQHGQEGLLVDARNVASIASAMETLSRDGGLRDSMTAAAGRLARGRFGLRRLETDLLAIYDGLSVVSDSCASVARPAQAPEV